MLIPALLAFSLSAHADLAGPCGCGSSDPYKHDTEGGDDSGDSGEQASPRRLAHELPPGAQAAMGLTGVALLLAAGRRKERG